MSVVNIADFAGLESKFRQRLQAEFDCLELCLVLHFQPAASHEELRIMDGSWNLAHQMGLFHDNANKCTCFNILYIEQKFHVLIIVNNFVSEVVRRTKLYGFYYSVRCHITNFLDYGVLFESLKLCPCLNS